MSEPQGVGLLVRRQSGDGDLVVPRHFVSFIDGGLLEDPVEQGGAFGGVGQQGDVDWYLLIKEGRGGGGAQCGRDCGLGFCVQDDVVAAVWQIPHYQGLLDGHGRSCGGEERLRYAVEAMEHHAPPGDHEDRLIDEADDGQQRGIDGLTHSVSLRRAACSVSGQYRSQQVRGDVGRACPGLRC
ncbi:hypothetical protein [Nonomuraea antri]|uniref:hypothetical protein n=1 Tax=Nonomuraea antri TaxID=2730852 RepID=UPI001C2BBAA1